MKVEDVYQFFFHPWSDEHSFETQIAATITDIALSILSGGLFLIPFLYFQWKDRDVKQMHNATAATKVASEILKSPNPPPVVRSTNTHLSSKARTVKEKQAWQLNQFEQWAASGQWSKIHNAHYDWWMYPIDQPSRGHGTTYQLNSREITELKADPEFMANYIRGVVLGAQAWGWDVLNVKPIDNPTSDQKWQNWDVRLGKMADSLRLFGEEELRASMRQYVQKNNILLQDWVYTSLEL